jgi:hypothetical protein
MTRAQLEEYDLFLDENDWDLYYWATQSPANTPTTLETAEGAVSDTPHQTTTEYLSPAAPGQAQETDGWRQGGRSFKPGMTKTLVLTNGLLQLLSPGNGHRQLVSRRPLLTFA